MTDVPLFLFGVFITGLLAAGVGFTIAEFQSMARDSVRSERPRIRNIS